MYSNFTEEQLKEGIDLLIEEKVISKELAELMLRENESDGLLVTRFSDPSIFFQEMLSLIGKEFLNVDGHYELGPHEGNY